MQMKKQKGVDKVEQMMTPMIDIVFQLLTFFVMTFKIATQEGDFNVKMPVGAPSSGNDTPLPPIRVRLLASAEGKLAGIQLGDTPVQDFKALHDRIREIVGPNTGPNSDASEFEVELDCDYGLHYSNVVHAISAASGSLENGTVVRMIEKIKFAPPRKGG